MLQKCLPRKTKTDFDSDWGRRGEDVLFLNVVLKQDRERGERERTARKHRRDFDLQSKKENRDFFWLPLEARRVRNAKRMVYPDEKSNCTTTRRLLNIHPFQRRIG